MANTDPRITIHMAASLDGFIARKDGSVDWLETSDEFAGGDTMDPGVVEAFLKTIDCYVMGSRTYETALRFEAQGLGWAHGDKQPSSSLVAIYHGTEIPLSSTQAILRSS
jgi:dihydrofolate reductase